jgi:hypothetical protein
MTCHNMGHSPIAMCILEKIFHHTKKSQFDILNGWV